MSSTSPSDQLSASSAPKENWTSEQAQKMNPDRHKKLDRIRNASAATIRTLIFAVSRDHDHRDGASKYLAFLRRKPPPDGRLRNRRQISETGERCDLTSASPLEALTVVLSFCESWDENLDLAIQHLDSLKPGSGLEGEDEGTGTPISTGESARG